MADEVRENTNGEIAGGERQQPGGEMADANQQVPLPPEADADLHRSVLEPQETATNPTYIYVAAAVGLGILLGIAFAANTWQQGSTSAPPTPSAAQQPKDLGSVVSSPSGLKGHLIAKWDDKFEYRLVVEPSDLAQRAAFALAVSDSPRPLSIAVQLKDSSATVLCGTEIVLKYDAGKAPVPAASGAKQNARKGEAGNTSGGQTGQGADLQQLEAQELARERGKDIFQNDTGADGQIESISAQGEIPCSMKAYESAASWSLSTDFPTLAEQADLVQRKADLKANAEVTAQQASAAGKTSVRRKKTKPAPAKKSVEFFIEGDDAIADYDAAGGVIETSAGKTFFIDKTAGGGNTSGWQDFPANFHYRCDQSASCILTRRGAAVLHAGLKR